GEVEARRMARWKAAGLVPGARVRMLEVRSLDDVFVLDVAGRRVVTGSEGLDGIRVEVGRGAGRSRASAGTRTR
ncbi:MAG TPA: hypothetical protein VJY35_14220, partial [Candidatus Eisenbacteria bacterium]|nr:hypothetical protein [Candidatus Eisenbacteria bacterium]